MNKSDDHSHEDEGVEEEMIFEFDEQDSGEGSSETKFTSLASFETNDTPGNRRRITFGASSSIPSIAELRPPNPVAALLQSREFDEESDDDDELKEFCPVPMRSFSAPPPRLGITPPAPEGFLFLCGRPDLLDINDRQKRKSMDDGAIGTCRVRPLAKRAKSFSLGRDSTALKLDYPTMVGSPAVAGSSRSESISIPRPASLRSLGSRARSRSGSTNAGDSASSHSHSSSSPSWNATASSLEYFCRRSLDVSSPLRVRFRDLMVGSVGRATSYTGP